MRLSEYKMSRKRIRNQEHCSHFGRRQATEPLQSLKEFFQGVKWELQFYICSQGKEKN